MLTAAVWPPLNGAMLAAVARWIIRPVGTKDASPVEPTTDSDREGFAVCVDPARAWTAPPVATIAARAIAAGMARRARAFLITSAPLSRSPTGLRFPSVG